MRNMQLFVVVVCLYLSLKVKGMIIFGFSLQDALNLRTLINHVIWGWDWGGGNRAQSNNLSPEFIFNTLSGAAHIKTILSSFFFSLTRLSNILVKETNDFLIVAVNLWQLF